jgi:myb proto-oncogene protein
MNNIFLRKSSDYWKNTIDCLITTKNNEDNLQNGQIQPFPNEGIFLEKPSSSYNYEASQSKLKQIKINTNDLGTKRHSQTRDLPFSEDSLISQSNNTDQQFYDNLFAFQNFGAELPIETENCDNISDKISLIHMLDRKTWTSAEDSSLLYLTNNCQIKNWKKISEIIRTKSPQQCSYRYQKLCSQHKRTHWTHKEDIHLVELMENYGKDWEKISERLGKSVESIKERYMNKLNPQLKRSKFSIEEDSKVIEMHEIYGNNWNEIAKHLPERNALMIKNRFYSVLRKKIVESKKHLYELLKINMKREQSSDIFNANSFDSKCHSLREENKNSAIDKEISLSKFEENCISTEETPIVYHKQMKESIEDQLKIDEICNNYRDEKEFFDVDMYFDVKKEGDFAAKQNTSAGSVSDFPNVRDSFSQSNFDENEEKKLNEVMNEISYELNLHKHNNSSESN